MAGNHTVGNVARLAGITIRTLHHYSEIGLLVPADRSPAGYRQYADADLERLSRILSYRELGFSLEAIRTLLDDASIDHVEHLRRQRTLLLERRNRLDAMIGAIGKELDATMTGINLTTEEKLEVFGASYNPEWDKEAEERWSGSEPWEQARQRSAKRTKDDWAQLNADMDELHRHLVEGFDAGLAPDSTRAMDLAESHRTRVSIHWDCSLDIHRSLVDMYLGDERFTKTYEDLAQGLTQWLQEAAHANADRLEARSGATDTPGR